MAVSRMLKLVLALDASRVVECCGGAIHSPKPQTCPASLVNQRSARMPTMPMGTGRNHRRRKATIVALCLVALSPVLAHDIQQTHSHPEESAISGETQVSHLELANCSVSEAIIG